MIRGYFFLLLVLVSISKVNSQSAWWYLNEYFEIGGGNDTIESYLDTISNPNNIWRIGEPDKTFLNSAYSLPNAAVTLLDTSYPPNDTSVIIFKFKNTVFYTWGNMRISFWHRMDSDPKTDFGIIEMSFDKINWINVNEDSSILHFQNFPDTSIYTGTIFWKKVEFFMDTSFIQDSEEIFLRFTFYSDSIDNGNEGWLIDNISIMSGIGGISDRGRKSFESKIFPNPSRDMASITFENPSMQEVQLEVFNSEGKRILAESKGTDRFEISTSSWSEGTYYYRLIQADDRLTSLGRFIVIN